MFLTNPNLHSTCHRHWPQCLCQAITDAHSHTYCDSNTYAHTYCDSNTHAHTHTNPEIELNL